MFEITFLSHFIDVALSINFSLKKKKLINNATLIKLTKNEIQI